MNSYDDKNDKNDIPLGLGIALAQNSNALNYFAGLSSKRRQQIIEQTHNIGSKKEMQNFVNNLNNWSV